MAEKKDRKTFYIFQSIIKSIIKPWKEYGTTTALARGFCLGKEGISQRSNNIQHYGLFFCRFMSYNPNLIHFSSRG